jgi:hypothetical protein
MTFPFFPYFSGNNIHHPRPWTFCRGRPSIASSIDTAATTGRVAAKAYGESDRR